MKRQTKADYLQAKQSQNIKLKQIKLYVNKINSMWKNEMWKYNVFSFNLLQTIEFHGSLFHSAWTVFSEHFAFGLVVQLVIYKQHDRWWLIHFKLSNQPLFTYVVRDNRKVKFCTDFNGKIEMICFCSDWKLDLCKNWNNTIGWWYLLPNDNHLSAISVV